MTFFIALHFVCKSKMDNGASCLSNDRMFMSLPDDDDDKCALISSLFVNLYITLQIYRNKFRGVETFIFHYLNQQMSRPVNLNYFFPFYLKWTLHLDEIVIYIKVLHLVSIIVLNNKTCMLFL